MSPESAKFRSSRRQKEATVQLSAIRTFDVALGELMASWRQNAGVSQDAVAVALGCDQGAVSRMEAGKRHIRVSVLLRYLDSIGRDVGSVAEELNALARTGESRSNVR